MADEQVTYRSYLGIEVIRADDPPYERFYETRNQNGDESPQDLLDLVDHIDGWLEYNLKDWRAASETDQQYDSVEFDMTRLFFDAERGPYVARRFLSMALYVLEMMEEKNGNLSAKQEGVYGAINSALERLNNAYAISFKSAD